MRYVRPATLLALSILVPASMFGQNVATQNLTISNYQLSTWQVVSPTMASYTYHADLMNAGPAMPSATATLGSLVSSIQMVAGQSKLNFVSVPANGHTTSTNTFTILVNRSATVDFSQLVWSIQGSTPIANAGPNQTTKVGQMVTLNGSGSTNPSGTGTLTYSWAFVSRPLSSTATLVNATSVTPQFAVDTGGTYVVQLTVSNGTASSSANVSITTNNSPPVANAGPNQTVSPGATVHLNGSGSSDVDGDPLSYVWSITMAPAGSTTSIANATSVTPTFVADKIGTYLVKLIVTDGISLSVPSTVTITTQNTPPVANAGPGQVVNNPALVHLDGSGSTDVDGNALTYLWSLTTVPSGSTAVLSSTTAVKPTFTADRPGTYVAQLIVNDGLVNSAPSTVTITTNTPLPPTANPGPNQTVAHHTTVTLTGSGTDPQGLALTYAWAITTKPTGSTAVLSSTAATSPTFFADLTGTYVVQLTVSDGLLSSAPATVTISTTDTAPTANAGPAQNVAMNSTVTLTGTSSADPDSDPITYAWSLTTRPAGSTASLTGATTVSPTFVADVAGVYVAQLIVSDGTLSSNPATVSITAQQITLTPNPLNLKTTPDTLVLTLSNAAGIGGQVVNLTSSNTTVATVPLSVTVLQGATTANVTVTPGTTLSNTNITASASGFASGQAVVNVSASTPTTIVATSGTPQNATVNTAFGAVLTATVKDANNNPVSGVAVTFAAPATGASGTFAVGGSTATTNASGVATSGVFTANAIAGTYSVTASAAGVGIAASFSMTNTTGTAVSIVTTSGTPQSVVINTAFGGVLTATVKDAGGNPVSGVAVTFAAPATGASGTFAVGGNTATTNASGVATSGVFTANAIAGTYSVTATAAGVATPASFSLTNLVGPAASITATTGTPQSTMISTAFGAVLTATVKDAGGNLVSGVTVTFAAPASGASGTFAVGGNTGTTNASGVATSGVFTANTTVGTYSVTATAAGVATPASFSLTNTTGPVASITATTGTPQSTTINTAFGTVLTATVKDAGGNAVSGVTVTFAAPGSGASGTFAVGGSTGTTNASGIATSGVFTANATSGTYSVTATAAGVATPASFSLTNTPGAAASITATTGTPQNTTINTAFAAVLTATVKDAGGNAVSGVTVTFAAPASGASGAFAVGGSTGTTNASGIATSGVFTANGTSGTYSVTATVAGVVTPANFSLTNNVGTPTSITATTGTPQNTTINTAFGAVLTATVKDVGNNPVSGVTVTFAAPASGASGTFAVGGSTGTTNASGIATSGVFTANAISGAYTVTATAAGVATPANFSLTNNAGAAATITTSAGTPQNATISTAFTNPLVALVKDASNNPVSGVTVTFTAPASGASATFAAGGSTAVTNASGLATSGIITANSTVGVNYAVAATVAGVATPANFLLTNTVGAASAITATSGTPQSATVSTAFGSVLKATVKDAGGNPVSGIAVTFGAPASGASGTFAVGGSAATTDVNGVATSGVFTANTTSGAYTVTATATGIATPANFSMTNLAGAATSITTTSGTPQSKAINTAFAALVATVKDTNGNPVSGVTVTFAAPSTGASGTFAANGNTATTNAAGQATSGVFTANSTAGAYTVTASAVGTPASFSLTNTPGPAASITAVSGGGQTGTISLAFANPLVASVKDSGGNPVSNVVVTFAAPSSGASGTFAAGGNTATTNAAGQATSGVFTANATSGTYSVTASVPGVGTPASYSLTNASGILMQTPITVGVGANTAIPVFLSTGPASPVLVTLTSSDPSKVTVTPTIFFQAGATAPNSQPQVTGVNFGSVTITASATGYQAVTQTVTSTDTIAFNPTTTTITGATTQNVFLILSQAAPAGGLTFNLSSSNTNVATVPSTVTISAASNSNSLTITGVAGGTAIIHASMLPYITDTTITVTVNALGISTTSLASGTTGVAYSQPLAASGGTTPYTWSIAAGSLPTGLSLNSSTGVISGITATTATNLPITFKVTDATAHSALATLTLTIAQPTGPASIAATSGTPQSTTISTAFGSALTATVKDISGNPVSGAVVTFTAPASGASGTFAGGAITATATTNASGVATSGTFTANSTAGAPYTVAASVTGVVTTANYSMTNLTGAAASVATVSGTPQTAGINTAFAAPLVASVKDSGGNPVSGVVVTFAVQGSGAGGAFAGGVTTATTTASGLATSAGFTANSLPGSFTITATAAGVATPASFLMTNTTVPAVITATSGSSQTAAIGTAFTLPLTATVKDSVGNLVSGITVTFTVQGTGAGATFAGGIATATSNAAGLAVSNIVTANNTVGTFTVNASASGVATPASFSLTNTQGSPAAITATGGTPQSAAINATFTNALTATVKDLGGNPVSNAVVTFTVVPVNGAGGSFAGGVLTATTNAAGQAVSAAFTANATAGAYTVTAASGAATGAIFNLTNQAGAAASIAATSGTPDSTVINTAFGARLVATVKDSGNNPVSGAIVTFAAPASGASGTFAGNVLTATTDVNGAATSAVFTANSTSGSYQVNATVTGVATPATFSLTNTPTAPASVTIVTGSGQSAMINTAFALPLKAVVKDLGGNLLSGITVTFTAPATGVASGTFTGGNTAVTDVNGVATSNVFTANSIVGANYTVAATVNGVATPANFSLSNTPGNAALISVAGGDAQNTTVGTAFGTALSAKVTDSGLNPISGATVTFTVVPVNGAGGTFAGGVLTATTNASGIATAVTFTANNTAGAYTVTATSGAITPPATFNLTNKPGAAASIAATGGTPQNTPISTAFATNLSATVKDANGNTVPGVLVTFVAPTTGATGTFAAGGNTATTNASGVATSGVFTANTTMGTYNVTASAGAVTGATFALTNKTGNASVITATSGTGQSAAINTQFAAALVATVKDAGGNLVSGASVTFTAPSTGASGTFAGGGLTSTVTTDVNGVATSALFTANATMGANYTVAATVTGVATPANFTLSNTVGAPATVTATGGAGQSATVGAAFTNVLKATVKDSSGDPVSGIVVTFTAPATTGASGTFAAGLTTATTDVNGIATSAVFTADGIAGSYSVTAAAGTATSATFGLTNNAGAPASITATGGTPQNTTISTAFANPLQATVKDAGGNLVSGAVVTFTAPASTGASGTFAGGVATAATNAAGIATSAVFTANGIANTSAYNVTATVTGVTPGATFALTNNAGVASKVTYLSGSPQSAGITAAFANPLSVTVTDAGGNLVSGATVTFAAPTTGASATFTTSNTAVSNASGVATSNAVTANLTTGAYQVIASVPNGTTTATFNLTNTVGAPTLITATGGAVQSVGIGTAYAAMSAKVTDAGGNPVSGQVVTFTAPSTGPSGSFGGALSTTANTDATGTATTAAIFTANTITGTFNVKATSGTATAANFALTNKSGAAASIAATAGSAQTATVNTPYALPLSATVLDSGSNPVSGASVTFTIQAAPGTAAFPNTQTSITVATNASGVASTTITAGTVATTFGVNASVTGVSAVATFTLTNTAGAPATITAGSGAGQQAIQGTSFTNKLIAIVKDSFGNLVSGTPVTFTAPTTNPTGMFGISNTYTVNTASNGQATSMSMIAGTASATTYNVVATAGCSGCSATFANFLNRSGSVTGAISVSSISVGQNLEAAITVSIPQAVASNVVVTLSCDSSKILIGNANVPGSCTPQTVTIAPGATFFTTFVQALQGSGTTAVTASASGYTTGIGTITMTPSGFVLSPNTQLAVGQNFTANAGVTNTMTVYPAQLDASNNYVALGQLRGGATANVTVSSSNPNTGTISGSGIVALTGGSTSGTIGFNPLAPGSTVLSVVGPAGYNVPTSNASLTATVNAQALTIQNVSVGKNLEATAQVSINAAATDDGLDPNHPGVHVTVTSSDPAVRFSLTGTDNGTASLPVLIPIINGSHFTQSQPFYVYGSTTASSATLTATALNFTPGSSTLSVTPSGFVIGANGGLGGTYPAVANSGQNPTIGVYPFQLDQGLNLIQQQPLAGYATTNITINNSNPGAGTLTSNTVQIVGGQQSNTTTDVFTPTNAGNTDLSILTQPTGFSTPVMDTTVTIQVNTPGIAINDPGTVGNHLETSGSVAVGTAPTSNLSITLTSSNPSLLLSNNGTDGGFSTIQVTIPAGSTTSQTYYLYGAADGGSVSYTASATGFTPRTNSIQLTPAGIAITGGFNPFGQYILQPTMGTDAPFSVQIGQIDFNGNFIGPESLNGTVQFPIIIPLTNNDPTVGTADAFVTLSAGMSTVNGTFHPLKVGQTNISINTQPFNATVFNDQFLVVQVFPSN